MKSKLYVGNLSFETTDQDLEVLFSDSGSVQSVNLIKDTYTGKTKGFGFVEMKNQQEAAKAIESLDNREFKGRNLKVNLANEKGKKAAGRRI